MYTLFWRSPALPFVQKQTPITVPAGAVISNAASLRFTGKGAANYGKIQQENMMRLLESFAGPTAPDFPTVGQTWYNTAQNVLNVCISTAPFPVVWQQLNSTQITDIGQPPPSPAVLGNTWFSRTGSASGVLYVFTGLGRFPAQNWNAATAYWPATSTTLAGILNCSVFANGANSNYNEVYIHGFTGATSADVNGSILVNSVVTSVPKGVLFTNVPTTNALIVWDTTSTLVGGGAYYQAVQTNDNRWFYDNNSVMVEFTPIFGMYAIGVVTVGSQDTNTAPGVTSATLWTTALSMPDMKQAPATLTGGAIGGWEQIWPSVDTAGGRYEYDQLYGLLGQLIGNPATVGGSGAHGKSIQYLTDWHALDASMDLAWSTITPNDVNALNQSSGIGRSTLRVDPTSQDWDNLLSACRYAVSRLELPAQSVADLSIFPFVSDGLPISPAVAAFATSDVRAMPALRGSRTKPGLIGLIAGYQATGNVLNAALQNRYLLKGLLQGSGSGNTFSPTVSTTAQVTFNANASSFSGTVVHGLNFVFPTLELSMQEFFFSAAALQVLMTHTPTGSGAADIALKAITDNFGRVLVTADNTYVMTPSPTPSLAMAPTGVGFLNFTSGGVTLATLTSGGATIVVRGILSAAGTCNIELDITAGGSTTGTFNVKWSYISDHETYGLPAAAVYPSPNAYAVGNATGSSLFV